MNEDYCTYEQSVLLKELGFDWKCYTFYHWDNWCGLSHSGIYENFNMFEKCVSAPTLAQAAKWLREKGYHIQITPNMTWRGWRILLYIKNGCPEIYDSYEGYKFDTYEKALSAGIDKTLELLKEQENGN